MAFEARMCCVSSVGTAASEATLMFFRRKKGRLRASACCTL
jgi:hypothetical protein